MFSEQKWNQQYNLGLGYECKFLCNRIVCYRELTTANISSLKQQCDDDQSKSGQQTYVVYPKQGLKNIITNIGGQNMFALSGMMGIRHVCDFNIIFK